MKRASLTGKVYWLAGRQWWQGTNWLPYLCETPSFYCRKRSWLEIIIRIKKKIDSIMQGLGGKVMLQYTGLAKKILDVLRPTQWSALFLNAFKMSWNPAIHCALYTTIEWILHFFCREWIYNIRSNPKHLLWNTNCIKMNLLKSFRYMQQF